MWAGALPSGAPAHMEDSMIWIIAINFLAWACLACAAVYQREPDHPTSRHHMTPGPARSGTLDGRGME